MKTGKHPADIWMVIDADHHLALTAPHEIRHALVVIKREVDAVARRLPIRWVHVVEGVGAVVAFGAVEPGEVFDVGASEALPGAGEVFLDAQQVDGSTGCGGTEGLSGDLAGEGMVLQVEEACGALDVSEDLGACHFLPFKYLPRAECPFELADKFFQVVLDDAVEVHQLAVDVVQDLDRRGLWAHEVQGRATGEDFDVALVGREKRDKTVGKTALAAHPGDDGLIQFVSKP